MRILVTGGAGFIGSKLLQYYKQVGHDVIVVDKLTYAGDRSRVPKEFSFFKQDVATLNWPFLLEKTSPEVIISMAAESHVDNSIAAGGSADFIQTNVVGVNNLVDGIRRYRMSTGKQILLVHVSTDEVCGDFPLGAVTGGYCPWDKLTPNNPYAATKASAELLIQAAHHTHRDFEYLIVRATNNYGPNQHFEKFLPTVISRALRGESIPVYGQGKNIREWLYSGDFVRGIQMLVDMFRDGSLDVRNRVDRIYHFGSDEAYSNIHVVNLILQKLQKPSSLISFVEDRPGHDRMYRLNWMRTRALGWLPDTKFCSEGLDIVIEDIRSRMGD